MSRKHLRGVENTTLRRRILRAERDLLPKTLLGFEPRRSGFEPRRRGFEPRRRGGALHAVNGPDPDPAPQPPLHGPRPVSETQTLIGTLPIPPDHPAASWLSTSWTVPCLADLKPENECHQTDADPDTVHASITRAEYPSTDFACFASAPSGNSLARAASISTDFSRVTSAENRAFARLLSSSAQGTRPGFLVGGAGARDSHACEFPIARQAGGGIG